MPSAGSFTRKFPLSRFVAGYSLNKRAFDLSDGSMSIEAKTFTRTDELLYIDEANHINDKGSVIRVLRGANPVAHFVVHDLFADINASHPYIDLTLVGPEWFLDRTWVPMYDYPRVPSINSEWIYGAESIIDDLGGEIAFEIQTIHRDSTVNTGQFTIVFGAETTANLDWDESASTIRTELEAFTGITVVDVEGTGSQFAPWTITFQDPSGDVAQVTIGTSTLNGNLYVTTLAQGGTVSPRPWHPSTHPVTGLQHGGLAEFTMVTSPVHAPSLYSLKIDAIAPQYPTDYAGGQVIVKVNDGGEYRAALWVMTEFAQPVRFVIRDMSETFIASVEMTLTPMTWTLMEIPFFVVPLGVDQIIYRVAIVVAGDPGYLYVDIETALLAPGKVASTIGVIMNDICDSLDVNFGALQWVTRTWSDTLDSSGNAWDQMLSWTVVNGQSLLQLLEYAKRWNYRWRFEWSVVNSRWEWDMWNPGGGTTVATGVGLLARGGVIESGKIARRVPDMTMSQADGDEGAWGIFIDSTLESVWGPLMGYSKNAQATDSVGLEALAEDQVQESLRRSDGVVVNTQNPEYLPWTHYREGQDVDVDLGPNKPHATMTVMAIVATKEAKTAPRYATHCGTVVYEGQSALVQSVRELRREVRAAQFTPKKEALVDPSFMGIQGGNISVWSLPGNIFTEVGRLAFQMDFYGAIIAVRVRVNIAPTGQSAIFDLNKNGVTVFPTQSLRPTIPATSLVSQLAVPENRTFDPGDFYTVDTDQVGSVLPGGHATVMLVWKETDASVY